MSLFPHDATPKPRALGMFLLGLVLLVAGVAGVVFSPASMLLSLLGGGLLGWFGMEFFCGEGPK